MRKQPDLIICQGDQIEAVFESLEASRHYFTCRCKIPKNDHLVPIECEND